MAFISGFSFVHIFKNWDILVNLLRRNDGNITTLDPRCSDKIADFPVNTSMDMLTEDMCENIEEEFKSNRQLLAAYFHGINHSGRKEERYVLWANSNDGRDEFRLSLWRVKLLE